MLVRSEHVFVAVVGGNKRRSPDCHGNARDTGHTCCDNPWNQTLLVRFFVSAGLPSHPHAS